MNQLQTKETGNVFSAYGDAINQRNIVGSLLKFTKGDYLANDKDMPIGTKLAVVMDEILVGWIKWQDNKPAEQLMGKLAEGHQPPRRSDLGYDDDSRWEIDDNSGRPRDPWQLSNYIPMVNQADGEVYTFTAASKGSLGAVGRLCQEYGKGMRAKPDQYPVIELGVDSYKHSNPSYGRIKVPEFKVVGWTAKDAVISALEGEAAATDEAETEIPKAAAAGKAATAKNARF